MKKVPIILTFVFCSIFASGQIFTQVIIATAGDYVVNEGVSLSWTLGETITESFIDESHQLTQGFHQSYNYEISLLPGSPQNDKYNINIYPNPTKNYFFVEVGADDACEPIKMALYNMQGIKLIEDHLNYSSKKKINVSHFPSDIFILVIMDEGNHQIQRYKIVKANM